MDFAQYQKQQINAELGWKTRRTVFLFFLTFLTLPIAMIFATVTVSQLVGRKFKIEQNEKVAIESLRNIISAQSRYFQITREFGDFDQLRAMRLIDPSFYGGTPSSSGYVFKMNVRPSYDTGVPAFFLAAHPENPGVTGVRHFFVNSRDYVIRSNSAKAATEADEPIAY